MAAADSPVPRVAFLPDSYLETNGAARTCRELVGFAERRGLPLLVIHFGPPAPDRRGAASRLALDRGRLAARVDSDLHFDLTFWRHRGAVERALRAFQPDVIHVTGPGELGLLASSLAPALNLPVVASWHTNVHEFAGRRFGRLLPYTPHRAREAAGRLVEGIALKGLIGLYRRSDLILAPNPELVGMLHTCTGKPVLPMYRGVDCELFRPERRDRQDGPVVLGHVGRLVPEKNVRLLVEVERYLLQIVHPGFRFFVAGQGSEREWLRRRLKNADFEGILAPEALARAYANMDILLFPSLTDTYGNVVQEALASGVPAVVMDRGGPKFIVQHGVSGYVAESPIGFAERASRLIDNPGLRRTMGEAGRGQMLPRSWDRVFESVWEAYREAVRRRKAG